MPSLALNPALGRASGAFTVALVSVASDGTTTAATAATVAGQITEWEYTGNNDMENISPFTMRQANEVIVETINSVRIAGFLFADDTIAAPTNPFSSASRTSDYVQIVGNWAGRTFTYLGPIKNYTEGPTGKGRINFSVEIGSTALTSANPVWS